MQLRLWNLNSPISANIEIHVPRVIASLLMSSPPINTSHQLFQCRYSNSRDVVASSPPPFSCSAARAFRKARSQTIRFLAWEQALHLGDIVKSTRARGTREETRQRGAARSRVLAQLPSLAQIGELARKLFFFILIQHQYQELTVAFLKRVELNDNNSSVYIGM